MEFAEEYSKKEKMERVILYTLLAIFVVIIHQKWILPYINWYVKIAHCHTFLGYSGVTVLWYSLFVGLPVFFSILVGCYSAPIGIKGLMSGQFPPKGVKVYKPTKIVRGRTSKIKSLAHLVSPLIFITIGIWGSFQIDNLPNSPKIFDYNICKDSE